MKILSYKHGADRIAWKRGLRLSAFRDDILIAEAQRLRRFKPNSASNIKHPWKLTERHSLRAWCPRHDGRWAKLVVRVADDGHVSYDCSQGCSHEDLVRYLNGSTRVPIVSVAEAIATAGNTGNPDNIGESSDSGRQSFAVGCLFDARARFRRSFKPDAA